MKQFVSPVSGGDMNFFLPESGLLHFAKSSSCPPLKKRLLSPVRWCQHFFCAPCFCALRLIFGEKSVNEYCVPRFYAFLLHLFISFFYNLYANLDIAGVNNA